jgi:rhamnose utilization protein RhaD (predicted bifunctional aldolase and dehydrogenase)
MNPIRSSVFGAAVWLAFTTLAQAQTWPAKPVKIVVPYAPGGAVDVVTRTTSFPRWDDTRAATLDAPGLLLYRSNLLGSDLRITNYGGGNTSAKLLQTDPLTGESVEVLWVKGSGGDVGSMKLDGFSTLYMDKLRALKGLYRGLAHEDEMVGYLPHCTFNLNSRAASIDTPLHSSLPYDHVDHMHPDAVIAIAAMVNSEAITQQVFEGTVGWMPWLRPGHELGQQLAAYDAAHPGLRGLSAEGAPKLLHLNMAPEVLEFVNSVDLDPLAALADKEPP